MPRLLDIAVWFALLLPLGVFFDIGHAGGQSTNTYVSLPQIVEAWHTREKECRSGEFSWEWCNEGIHRWRGNRDVWTDTKGKPRPAENRLFFKDGQIRYEANRWLCDPRLRLDSGITNQFDVAALREFADSTVGQLPLCSFHRIVKGNVRFDLYTGMELPYSRGEKETLSEGSRLKHLYFQAQLSNSTDCGSMGYAPLLLHYHMLHSAEIAFQVKRASLSDHVTRLQGLNCLCVVEVLNQSEPRLERRYWVDPMRRFAVLRYQGDIDGQTVSQLDIQYEQNSGSKWAPTSWTTQVFTGQHDRWPVYMKASVSNCKLNKILTEELFCEKYPANTIVFDHHSNCYFLEDDDGGHREITRQELSKLATKLRLHTPAAIIVGQYPLLLAVLILVFCATFWRFRKVIIPSLSKDQ